MSGNRKDLLVEAIRDRAFPSLQRFPNIQNSNILSPVLNFTKRGLHSRNLTHGLNINLAKNDSKESFESTDSLPMRSTFNLNNATNKRKVGVHAGELAASSLPYDIKVSKLPVNYMYNSKNDLRTTAAKSKKYLDKLIDTKQNDAIRAENNSKNL